MKSRKLPAPERPCVPWRERPVPSGPLTPIMRAVLVAVEENYRSGRGAPSSWVGAAVSQKLGLEPVRRMGNGAVKGSWSGTMADNQRIMGPLGALVRRGLLFRVHEHTYFSPRYFLTTEGEAEVEKIKREETMMGLGYRTDAGTADGADEAVWVEEGYGDEELNLDPCPAADVTHPPGTTVTIDEDHDEWGGETGVVKAAGMGTGVHSGITYDVLIDGTSEPERFAESELC